MKKADVECVGRAPGRILEQSHARVFPGDFLEDPPRRIPGTAVDEEKLDRALEALRSHRGCRFADMGFLVEHGHQDRHVEAGALRGSAPRLGHGDPSRPESPG